MDIDLFFSTLDSMFQSGNRSEEIEAYLTASREQAESEDDPGAEISVCNELCGFYRVRGEYDKGRTIMEKALRNIERLGMERTNAHAVTLLNYGTLLTHANDTAGAVRCFSQATEILEKDPSQSYYAATLHNNVSSLYLRTGDISAGLLHSGKALAILSGMSGVGDETGVTYTIRAQLFLNAGQTAETQEAIALAGKAFKTDAQASPLHKAVMEQCLSELLFGQERYGEACAACERGIDLLESSPVQSPALDALRERKAMCLERMRKNTTVDIM